MERPDAPPEGISGSSPGGQPPLVARQPGVPGPLFSRPTPASLLPRDPRSAPLRSGLVEDALAPVRPGAIEQLGDDLVGLRVILRLEEKEHGVVRAVEPGRDPHPPQSLRGMNGLLEAAVHHTPPPCVEGHRAGPYPC